MEFRTFRARAANTINQTRAYFRFLHQSGEVRGRTGSAGNRRGSGRNRVVLKLSGALVMTLDERNWEEELRWGTERNWEAPNSKNYSSFFNRNALNSKRLSSRFFIISDRQWRKQFRSKHGVRLPNRISASKLTESTNGEHPIEKNFH